MLVAANAVVVVGLWWRQGGIREVHDLAGLLTSLGRVTGLLGAYLALVELLLLARIPVLDAVGIERMARWHRRNGVACLALLVAHTVLITAGYALDDGVSLTRETDDLLTRYSGVLLATIGLGLLVVVVVSSVVAVRRRLSYRVWHALHVSAYLAIALAFSHQLATGREFQGQPVARAYWWALYAVALGALVGLRLVLPFARSLRHRLRIERVVPEAPGIVSRGDRRRRARAPAGAGGPVAALALPGARALVGDAPVLAVGRARRSAAAHHRQGRRRLHAPAGVAAGRDARDHRGAVGRADERRAPPSAGRPDRGRGGHLADPRAARGHAGRAGHHRRHLPRGSEDDVLFRDELDELAQRRGAELHYVLGERRGDELLSAEHLQALVPDIASRDVYVCGPPA